eukprot:CAMPEP_0170565768 /NCGR_PEP_ID=MMETSP0211-20121228/79399_1 /TAXON_ID=311385 /ORGANISM="Pseudokeronopsis sp., Strain OXSARD2" /LENGTH=123 /DNA_ID=CAMNT_0010886729 /DNA_START=1496 /DNA_END=1867 /DNA_ORIENTATION=-
MSHRSKTSSQKPSARNHHFHSQNNPAARAQQSNRNLKTSDEKVRETSDGGIDINSHRSKSTKNGGSSKPIPNYWYQPNLQDWAKSELNSLTFNPEICNYQYEKDQTLYANDDIEYMVGMIRQN